MPDEEQVIEIYEKYAVNGDEPAEIGAEMGLDLADIHEAIAYYYRNSKSLTEMRYRDGGFDTPPMDDFLAENQTADELNEPDN